MFGEPDADELDPDLLLWWLHRQLDTADLPGPRFTVYVPFTDHPSRYWIVVEQEASICLVDPGFDVDVTVRTDRPALYRAYLGRTSLRAPRSGGLDRPDRLPRRRCGRSSPPSVSPRWPASSRRRPGPPADPDTRWASEQLAQGGRGAGGHQDSQRLLQPRGLQPRRVDVHGVGEVQRRRPALPAGPGGDGVGTEVLREQRLQGGRLGLRPAGRPPAGSRPPRPGRRRAAPAPRRRRAPARARRGPTRSRSPCCTSPASAAADRRGRGEHRVAAGQHRAHVGVAEVDQQLAQRPPWSAGCARRGSPRAAAAPSRPHPPSCPSYGRADMQRPRRDDPRTPGSPVPCAALHVGAAPMRGRTGCMSEQSFRTEHDSLGEVPRPRRRAVGGADAAGGGELPGQRAAAGARARARPRAGEVAPPPASTPTWGCSTRTWPTPSPPRRRRWRPGRTTTSSRWTCSRPAAAPART